MNSKIFRTNLIEYIVFWTFCNQFLTTQR